MKKKFMSPARNQSLKEFGGRKAYRETMRTSVDGGSLMRTGAAAVGGAMMYGVAGRAWN
jgi:hypothetical protein